MESMRWLLYLAFYGFASVGWLWAVCDVWQSNMEWFICAAVTLALVSVILMMWEGVLRHVRS